MRCPDIRTWKSGTLNFGVLQESKFGTHKLELNLNTVDSRSNGSAYNKNPSLTTFLFVPMELFLLLYIMAVTTFHSNNKFH